MTDRNTKSANKAAACDKEGINVDIKQQIDAIKTNIDEGDGKLSRIDASRSKLCDETAVLKREMNRSSFSKVVKSEVGRSVQAINDDVKSVQITLNKIVEAKEGEANMILFGLKKDGWIFDGLDVMVLTETWHGLAGNFAIGLAKSPGFQFVDYIREHDPGHGGLIVYFRKENSNIKS
ncbi:hypothetical protein HELRODRAFT_166759 [Helobdella robusta]|uniref:Uncharacterized protein n=1 Tax=Helobdella robusta TaxID=6412 RepID=T1EYH3_HELRO|nr:hypothetical protein HELRODRAFT_166759 [Helobdella robusta]ESO11735.1 hypothetical protein HELRODRAFT_166759 [Helobdella robusta]